MLPTADASSVDVAPLDPFLESAASHTQSIRQVAHPPLVDRQPLGGPAPRAQTQSVDQVPGTLRRESDRGIRWRAETLPVEAFSDLTRGPTGRDGRLDQPPDPREVGP